MDILGLLPLLNGWSWVRITGNKDISSNSDEQVIYESEGGEFGWLINARMSSDVSDMELDIIYDPTESGQTLTFRLNPEYLNTEGFSYRSNMPYVANYDPTNSEYAAEFVPEPPLAMKGTITVVAMPGSSDGKIYYDVQILRVTDLNAFVESVRAVFGINTMIELLNSINKPSEPVKLPEITPVKLPEITPRQYTGFLP